jgi:putative pyruvate formate lyase activating enzyme
VNRLAGELGYCRTGAGFQVGAICLHQGEEPVIGGEKGICNVFFTRCNLQCVYCQNHQISRNTDPQIEYTLTLDEVVRQIETVLDQGAPALGLVSPSHVIPQVRALIRALREKGRTPVTIYNTHAYDRVESLKALAPLIRVWLPDLKYMDEALALRLSHAPRYPAVATAAIREMVRQKGLALRLNGEGEIQEGVIVRHLVLPGQVENSKAVLRFLAGDISQDITISIMAQYSPTPQVAGQKGLERGVTQAEYDEVLDEMDFLGLETGWTQELDRRDNYRPDFAQSHPFDPGLGPAGIKPS